MSRKLLIALLLFALIVPMGCGTTTLPTDTPLAPTVTPASMNTLPAATAVPEPTSSTNVPLVGGPEQPVVAPTEEPALSYALPQGLPIDIVEAIGDIVPDAVRDDESGTIAIAQTGDVVAAEFVYVPVTAFPTLVDSITVENLIAFWDGDIHALDTLGEGAPITLYLSQTTLDALSLVLGMPSEDAAIEVIAAHELVDTLWDKRPAAMGIVGFQDLDPQLTVLHLDEQNPLAREMDLAQYPLSLELYASGSPADLLAWGESIATNRDLEQMTSLVMTGVTALVRVTADKMEKEGVLYPAMYISDTLQNADITHISNEIPFSLECPQPDPNMDDLVFCSDPSYIELLRAVGTDIVELTGNHFQDYGSDATLMTLEMYRQEGWPYYGGGQNLNDAQMPANLHDHGNTLSFLGCNPVGPPWAFATDDQPGCLACDWDYMQHEIAALAHTVDVPIVTFQYWEFYHYEPTAQQQVDFRAMVDAGAKIVSGSQAHHPQALEFYNGAFIHYGLGNLFFDQMWSKETRQIVVDRHTIYGGKHISTELLTYTLENYAQPRPMTEEERVDLLTSLYQASGWMGTPMQLVGVTDDATPLPTSTDPDVTPAPDEPTASPPTTR